MKKILLIIFSAVLFASCDLDSFLDVNKSESSPQQTTAEMRMLSMQDFAYYSTLIDNCFLSRYTQYWCHKDVSVSDQFESNTFSGSYTTDVNMWRMCYWSIGTNAKAAIDDASARGGWHMVGAVQTIAAWTWMATTDRHGDMPLKEAFTDAMTPDYDNQKEVYDYVDTLLNRAILNFDKTNNNALCPLSAGDKWYNGAVSKWRQLAYALKARRYNHLSKKDFYDPAKVIEYCDKSFQNKEDEPYAFWNLAGTKTFNWNPFCAERTNMENVRPTQLLIQLLDGTLLGTFDPRLPKLVNPSEDGVFRGINPPSGPLGANVTLVNKEVIPTMYRKPWSLKDSKVTFISYAEMQFIKAEAAFKQGNKTISLEAFKKGVISNMEYCKVKPDSINTYMSSSVIPQSGDLLTISDIMTQKYIAMMLIPDEAWVDLRRHDFNPNIFKGLHKPGKIVEKMQGNWPRRLSFRYHSEGQYNKKILMSVEALKVDQTNNYPYLWKKVWWDRASSETNSEESEKVYKVDINQYNK